MRIAITSKSFNVPHWREFFAETISVEEVPGHCLKPEVESIWIPTAVRGWKQLASSLIMSKKVVVILALSPSSEEAKVAFGLGVQAYLHAAASTELLQNVSTTIAAGGYWLPQDMLLRLVGQLNNVLPAKQVNDSQLACLTHRELEVCREVAHGHPNKRVAKNLGITERTVKEHLSRSFAKLNVKDRMQLMLLMNGNQRQQPL
ncbi:MAG: Response regulator containing a CheY-like receiver domain and an HTH DNA-binding domain [Marinobacter excellens HL-55]|uniref:Response regulator containing a CheY-like receiver domain and an HTH DNA-binding domain n=1 Tax=Marinobacter excellens HL-55 TaxID=1305731 RepID=A0A0P8B2R5_9GAMM|nr:MAG: Response regulator containing a CheY-like receiver domain and an HTH DNA-binding domain [Marinobacter excellens HL-55]